MSQNRSAENKEHDPLVSVLVLNYNGRKFLPDCFESLVKTAYPNFEIVLVDNHSTDDSVGYTRRQFPQVRIVETGANGGYSRAYNIAFQHAAGKYYVLLNNDVKVDPDWLHPLVAAAENDPQIAALQPKLLAMLQPGQFEYAGASGGFIDRYGYPFLRGRVFYTMEQDAGQYDDEVEVFWTSGAAMFVRAEALAKTALLDEDFVHHMEEIDLCWRLRLAGYKLKVIPESKIYHYAGATIAPDSFKKVYWNFRNSLFMLIKNFETGNLLKVLPIRFFLDTVCLAGATLKFDFMKAFAVLKAYAWLICHLPLILKKRKDSQSKRVLSDDRLRSMIHHESVLFAYFFKGKKTYTELMNHSLNTEG
ncbi:MAG: glycosyltransferase family 2 protein [bacterium]